MHIARLPECLIEPLLSVVSPAKTQILAEANAGVVKCSWAPSRALMSDTLIASFHILWPI